MRTDIWVKSSLCFFILSFFSYLSKFWKKKGNSYSENKHNKQRENVQEDIYPNNSSSKLIHVCL